MANKPKPSSSKRRLGRGLSSLIINSTEQTPIQATYEPTAVPLAPSAKPSVPTQAAQTPPTAGPASREIPVDQIAANPYQPRKEFSPEELSDLAASIARQGILQPLLVRPAGDSDAAQPYVLIAGERRLRAAKQAGLADVSCVVRDASRQEMLEWALVENIQRKDLNPIERAEAYRQYVDRFELTQAEAAERLGQGRATIANHLRLLELQFDIQDLIRQGELSFGHGKVLAGLLDEPARQLALAKKAAREDLSVRQLEELVAAGAATGRPASPKGERSRQPYISDMEQQLSQAFGTRVTIKPGRAKNSGRVVIEYYSLDDFDRIAAALGARQVDL